MRLELGEEEWKGHITNRCPRINTVRSVGAEKSQNHKCSSYSEISCSEKRVQQGYLGPWRSHRPHFCLVLYKIQPQPITVIFSSIVNHTHHLHVQIKKSQYVFCGHKRCRPTCRIIYIRWIVSKLLNKSLLIHATMSPTIKVACKGSLSVICTGLFQCRGRFGSHLERVHQQLVIVLSQAEYTNVPNQC